MHHFGADGIAFRPSAEYRSLLLGAGADTAVLGAYDKGPMIAGQLKTLSEALTKGKREKRLVFGGAARRWRVCSRRASRNGESCAYAAMALEV